MKGKKSGNKKRGNDNKRLIYLFMAALISLSALLYLISESGKKRDHRSRIKIDGQREIERILSEKDDRSDEPSAAANTMPRLAVIIDDIGHNRRFVDLININVPMTLAVIPYTPYSLEAATQGYQAGLEVILHLPMEPKGFPALNPGEGALLTSMQAKDILHQSIRGLDAVPNIRGVNNHMGSLFTEDSEGMTIVLKEIKKRNLFFLDSKTSNDSKGFSLARAMKIKTAKRDIFLDNINTEEAITHQLMEAIAMARSRGEAVAIGHPYEATISVLKRIAPTLKGDGVELVLASSLTR